MLPTARRFCRCALLALALALALATPALAGGWTNVTLDRLPTDARAGQRQAIGFMVRQHGVTPINNVTPLLRARNAATGETANATARQEGAVGHFVADITFPSAGTWMWSVTPAPFPPVELGNVTILSATAPAPQTAAPGVPSSAAATARVAARWTGALALLVAVGLCAWSLGGRAARHRAFSRGR